MENTCQRSTVTHKSQWQSSSDQSLLHILWHGSLGIANVVSKKNQNNSINFSLTMILTYTLDMLGCNSIDTIWFTCSRIVDDSGFTTLHTSLCAQNQQLRDKQVWAQA